MEKITLNKELVEAINGRTVKFYTKSFKLQAMNIGGRVLVTATCKGNMPKPFTYQIEENYAAQYIREICLEAPLNYADWCDDIAMTACHRALPSNLSMVSAVFQIV